MRNHLIKAVIAFGVLVLSMGLVAGSEEEIADVAGKWQLTMQTPRGERTMALNFEQDGANLSGMLEGPRGATELKGKVKGNEVTFTITRKTPRGERELKYRGTLKGDTLKGKVDMGRREMDWSATRSK